MLREAPHQQVAVQIRDANGQLLCAQLPAGTFTKRRKAFRFSRKKTPLPVEIARDLDRMRVKPGAANDQERIAACLAC